MAPSPSNEDKAPPCYLLELPPELRLIVYEYIFPKRQVEIRCVERIYKYTRDEDQETKHQTSILQPCRAIFAEGRPILYEHTKFVILIRELLPIHLSKELRYDKEIEDCSFLKYVQRVELTVRVSGLIYIELLSNYVVNVLEAFDYGKEVRELEIRFQGVQKAGGPIW